MRDYYDILGISKGASDSEIKKGYHKKAKEYHPDRHKGDKEYEAKFKEVNEAYETLSDSQKRSAYDRYGHDTFKNGGAQGGGFQGAHGFGSAGFQDIFSDIFSDFMGGGRQQGSSHQHGTRQDTGDNFIYDLSITLLESYHGVKKDIKYRTAVTCKTCNATGSKSGKKGKTCGACMGSGRMRIQQGFFAIEQACKICQGEGTTISDPCNACGGEGRTPEYRTVSLNIPAGIESGTKMRVTGEGGTGLRGAPNGDLYVSVTVRKHELFEREHDNLYCEIPVKMTTAVLGGSIEIPSLGDKKLTIKIPEGSQSESMLRLRGKGMKNMQRGDHGDLYVKLNVEIPVNLSNKQKDLLKMFEEESNNSSHPKITSFLSRIKKIWSSF